MQKIESRWLDRLFGEGCPSIKRKPRDCRNTLCLPLLFFEGKRYGGAILSAGTASGQSDERADTTFRLGSRWLIELDPDDQPDPDYSADPRRPRMQVCAGIADSDIPATSDGRGMLDLGSR